MTRDESIERRLHEIGALAKEYATAHAKVVYLSEFRKSKKAILMRGAERAGVKSVSAQEREAYAHTEYLELLIGLQAATEEKERLRWELEITRMRFDAWRTRQANERAEMSMR